MKHKTKPALPRRNIEAVCTALDRAVAAVRAAKPQTRKTLLVENRLLRLRLSALRLRNQLYPGPSTEHLLMQSWRAGWAKPVH